MHHRTGMRRLTAPSPALSITMPRHTTRTRAHAHRIKMCRYRRLNACPKGTQRKGAHLYSISHQQQAAKERRHHSDPTIHHIQHTQGCANVILRVTGEGFREQRLRRDTPTRT